MHIKILHALRAWLVRWLRGEKRYTHLIFAFALIENHYHEKKGNEVPTRWMFASPKHALTLYIYPCCLAYSFCYRLKFTWPEYKLSMKLERIFANFFLQKAINSKSGRLQTKLVIRVWRFDFFFFLSSLLILIRCCAPSVTQVFTSSSWHIRLILCKHEIHMFKNAKKEQKISSVVRTNCRHNKSRAEASHFSLALQMC